MEAENAGVLYLTLAAPRCRKANSRLLEELIAWYKVLGMLPGMEAALAGT